MVRKFSVLVFALALAALGVVPAGAAEQARSVGNAESSLQTVTLNIGGLALPLVDVLNDLSLGSLRSYASTDVNSTINSLGNGAPYALSSILLPGGQALTAASDGATQQGGQEVALPGGAGNVTAGSVEAIAGPTSAQSTITALQGSVNALLASLSTSLPENGVVSMVNENVAAASDGALLSDVSIGLGDLLPPGLLDLLPLQTVLDLLQNLPLDSAQLTSVVSQLESVLDGLGGLESLIGQLTGVVAQLDTALAPLQGALDSAGGAGVPLSVVTQVINDLTGIQTGSLAQLTSTVTDTLTGVLGQIGVIDGLDLNNLLDGLLGNIADLELIGIDQLSVGVAATSRADSSESSAICNLSGVQVLGQAMDIAGCNQLNEVLNTVSGSVLGILGSLPVVGGLTDGLVTLDGLTTSTSAPNAVEGAYQVASSSVTGLRLGLGSVGLEDITGGLVNDLLGTVTGLLGGDLAGLLGGDLTGLLSADPTGLLGGPLDNLLGGGLPGLDTGLTDLLGGLTSSVADTGGTGGSSLTTDTVNSIVDTVGSLNVLGKQLPGGLGVGAVTGALNGLLGDLSILPTGLGLDGLATPSIDLQALDVVASSSFARVAGGAPPAPIAQLPVAQVPTPTTTLPRTGSGLTAALLLASAGAGASIWIRRRRPGTDLVS